MALDAVVLHSGYNSRKAGFGDSIAEVHSYDMLFSQLDHKNQCCIPCRDNVTFGDLRAACVGPRGGEADWAV